MTTPPPVDPGPLTASNGDSRTREHLKLLGIFYYIFAGLTSLGACFMLLYIVFGVFILAVPEGMNDANARDTAGLLGGTFVFAGGCGGAFILAFALLYFMTAQGLRKQTNKTICYVGAAVSCLNIPLGTILGVFTFVVMARPEAKRLFDANAQARPR